MTLCGKADNVKHCKIPLVKEKNFNFVRNATTVPRFNIAKYRTMNDRKRYYFFIQN